MSNQTRGQIPYLRIGYESVTRPNPNSESKGRGSASRMARNKQVITEITAAEQSVYQTVKYQGPETSLVSPWVHQQSAPPKEAQASTLSIEASFNIHIVRHSDAITTQTRVKRSRKDHIR